MADIALPEMNIQLNEYTLSIRASLIKGYTAGAILEMKDKAD